MTTIELYNALVKAGVKEGEALRISDNFLSKEEADERYSRKDELEVIKISIGKIETKLNMLIGSMLAINSAILVTVLFK